VRLQPERGQHVVTSGPYRLVRHPGYTGGLLLLLSVGLALGSWIAIVPMLLIVPFMVRRTLIEERMLATALPDYVDYMQRVRPRIVPGVW
jgi:protein-S-isoprenylcysteine O-methyltransferase Ste14